MTQFTISNPMCITSRLLPGIRIGDALMSVEPMAVEDGRVEWRIFIDPLMGRTLYESEDGGHLSTGAHVQADSAGAREAVSSLLSFLASDAERFDHAGGGMPAEGYSFNETVAEWASMHADDISILACEFEEADDD